MFSRNLAFIVGINNYQNGISPLRTAVNDAKKLAEVLRKKHQYQVWICLDEFANLHNLNKFIEETLPAQVSKDDRLLFYFAGHGVALNGDDGPAGYLIPQDAKLGDTNTYLSMIRLHDALIKLPCRHFLGILDCCFAGAFRWSSTRDLLTTSEVIYQERYDRFIQDSAWQIITSSASDQKALDSFQLDKLKSDNFNLNTERGQIGNHSPFATALLEALEGAADTHPPAKNGKPAGDGVITATELYLHLRDRVETSTEKCRLRQTPGIWCLNKHDKGEYIFLAPEHELNLPPAPTLDESKNPYRGLNAFEEEHNDCFFGRSELVDKLQFFVKTNSLTVVLGASGSGKSSLVKAGLIPFLKKEQKKTAKDKALEQDSGQGLDNNSEQKLNQNKWYILPSIRPGEMPFQSLNNALIPAGLQAIELDNPHRSLTESVTHWVKENPDKKLLIFVDQVEEIITLCPDQQQRQEFFQQLLTAIKFNRHHLRVVLTLRSDFEAQIRDAGLKFVPQELKIGNTFLQRRWQNGRFIVPVMTRSQLREAIENPLRSRVMFFQPDHLVDQLIDEVADMPGALPLLSFTLSELFLKYLKRQHHAQSMGNNIDRSITQADYEELGGVMQSLTHRADEEYQALLRKNPAYEQVIRHVMLRMVATGGGELARRQVSHGELQYPPEKNVFVQQVINRFCQARLLVSGENSEGNPYVEPTHDALIRGWEKLLIWVQEEKNLELQRRLTPSAFDWKQNQNKKYLWNSSPYLDVLAKEVLQSRDRNWLNQVETDFVYKSIRRKRKNGLIRLGLVSGAFLLLSAATSVAINFAIDAQNRFVEASSISAKSLFDSGQQLEGLIAATRTGEMLKSNLGFTINDKNRMLVIDNLRKIIGDVKEKNRLDTNETAVSVSYSPDGKLLAALNQDGMINLWQADGKFIQQLSQKMMGIDKVFTRIRFSSDGKKIFISSREQGLKIWQLQSNGKFHLHQPFSEKFMTFALHPQKPIIATSSLGSKSIIQLWSWDGKRIITFTGHTDRINDLDFSPNGKILVSGSAGKTNQIGLWDISSRERLIMINAKNNDVSTVKFVNDKMILVGFRDGIIKLFNINGNLEHQFEQTSNEEITSLAISPDRQYLASSSKDRTVRVWDIKNRELLHTFRGHKEAVNEVTFNNDNNQTIVSASADKTIRVWQIKNQITSNWAGKSPQFSVDGKTLVTLEDKVINIWQVNHKLEHQFQLKRKISVSDRGNLLKASISSDGQLIASTGDDGTIQIWNLEGKLIKNLPVCKNSSARKNRVSHIRFRPHHQTIASLCSQSSSIEHWNLDGQLLNRYNSISIISKFEFSPNSQKIAYANDNGTLTIGNVNAKNERFFKTLSGHTKNVIDVAFSPNGNAIASASEDGSIGLWSAKGELIRRFPAFLDWVSMVQFSPNGRMLFSTGSPNAIKVWGLNGELLYPFDEQKVDFSEILFFPHREIMLSTDSETKGTKVWNLDVRSLLQSSCNWLGDYLHNSQQSQRNNHFLPKCIS